MDVTGKEQLCGKINDLPMMDPGMHMPVSYTHLDVYQRQGTGSLLIFI